MGKFSGYLICTDCDGTLTYEPGKVSEENAEAIRYFQKEGGKFTLATGRFPGHAHEFSDQIKINAPMVALNGTVLYDLENEKILHEWTATKEDYLELFDYIDCNYPEVWECWINYTYQDSISFKPGKTPVGDETSKKRMEPLPDAAAVGKEALEKIFEPLPDGLYKALSFQNTELTQALQKDLKEKFGHKFRFDTSWPEGLEIQPVHSGKGVAVQYMKEQMDYTIHTTIGVGDYENDLTLLECADIGYAVENALDSVKAVADRVTVSNKEHAIAKIIYELEREMKK